MMRELHASPDDGSTVVELLVAASLTILVTGLLASDVLPALGLLERTAEPDVRRVELASGVEVVARAVRAARPGVAHPAVTVHEAGVTLALERGARLEIILTEGSLVVDPLNPHGPGARPPTRVLVEGLDMSRSRIALLDRDGVETADVARAAAVLVVLVDAESDHEAVQVVALRLGSHLDGATRW